MIRTTLSLSRSAAIGAAVLLAGTALAACGSSSSAGGSPSSAMSSTDSMAPSTGSSTSVATGVTDPSITALCTGLNAADLSSLSQAKDPASAEQAWAKLAADAPDAIKPDMQTIDSYLKAVVAKDYASLGTVTSQLQTALMHVETYITTNCHA